MFDLYTRYKYQVSYTHVPFVSGDSFRRLHEHVQAINKYWMGFRGTGGVRYRNPRGLLKILGAEAPHDHSVLLRSIAAATARSY